MRTTVCTMSVFISSVLLLGTLAYGGKAPAEPEVQWAVTAGDTGGRAWGGSVAAFSDGSSILAGGFQGTAVFGRGETEETTLTEPGSGGAGFHARYMPDGSLRHARSVVGDGFTGFERVATSPDDTYVVCGTMYGDATFGAGEANETIVSLQGVGDGFVARYDEDGRLLWVNSIFSHHWIECLALTTRPDGSILAGGHFDGEIILGAGEVNETILDAWDGIDGFIACYETDGSLRWGRRIDAVSSGALVIVWGLSSFADGSFAAGGDFVGAATFGVGGDEETLLEFGDGAGDAFVAHYESDGALRWAGSVTGPGSQSAYDVGAWENGSIFVVGSFNPSATFPGKKGPQTLTGISDGFLAEFDKRGNARWATSISGAGFNVIEGLSVLKNGSVLCSGYFMGEASVGSTGKGGPGLLQSSGPADLDSFVARYARGGKLDWSLRIGGPGGLDPSLGVAATGSESLLVAGAFTTEASVEKGSDAPILFGHGVLDAYLVRLESPRRDDHEDERSSKSGKSGKSGRSSKRSK